MYVKPKQSLIITDQLLSNNGLVYHNIMLEQYIMHDVINCLI